VYISSHKNCWMPEVEYKRCCTLAMLNIEAVEAENGG
jgi:hypothetical protein